MTLWKANKHILPEQKKKYRANDVLEGKEDRIYSQEKGPLPGV